MPCWACGNCGTISAVPGWFFADHIKRYSQSRRKAPIYWLLQSPKRSYGIWLYYQRPDRHLLAKACSFCVEPKIRPEEV